MAGSETPRPGWWQARDGNWYPPEALPPGWYIDVDGGARQRQPVAPTRSEPLPIRTPTYTTPPPRGSSSKRWRIGAAVAAIVAIGVAAVILTESDDRGGDDRTTTETQTTAAPEAARVLESTTVPATTLNAPPAPTQPPTTRPPTTPPPATTPPPTCSASMSNASPPRDAVVSVVVESNLANTPVQVTVAYRTTTMTFPATTNAAGAATIDFSVGKATIGFRVPVTVTVGPATCSTSFTTR